MSEEELEGKEPAAAVALKQGWERGFGGFWTLPSGPDDAEDLREIYLKDYRPDLNIAQAWELLEGFIYAIDNFEFRILHDGLPVSCYLRNDSGAWRGLGDRPEEAICRAFLKAKEAQHSPSVIGEQLGELAVGVIGETIKEIHNDA